MNAYVRHAEEKTANIVVRAIALEGETVVYVGSIPIASYAKDSILNSRTNKSGKYFTVFSKSPFITMKRTHYETEEECLNVCVRIAREFITRIQIAPFTQVKKKKDESRIETSR